MSVFMGAWLLDLSPLLPGVSGWLALCVLLMALSSFGPSVASCGGGVSLQAASSRPSAAAEARMKGRGSGVCRMIGLLFGCGGAMAMCTL